MFFLLVRRHPRSTPFPNTTPFRSRVRADFAPPPYGTLADDGPDPARAAREAPGFADWLRGNVERHRQPGYAVATVSLKPIGGVPGDATAARMEGLAEIADRFGFGEIRVRYKQNLVLPDIRKADLHAVWRALDALGLATANAGLVTDIIACPGLDYCNLANARSIPIAQRLGERFADLDRQHDLGPITLNISGCINACGHHHIADIGILGVDKKGVEFYQITLGGAADGVGAIGAIVGRAFAEHEVVDAVEAVLDVYLSERRPGERFVETYRRIGLAPFKERLYAPA